MDGDWLIGYQLVDTEGLTSLLYYIIALETKYLSNFTSYLIGRGLTREIFGNGIQNVTRTTLCYESSVRWRYRRERRFFTSLLGHRKEGKRNTRRKCLKDVGYLDTDLDCVTVELSTHSSFFFILPMTGLFVYNVAVSIFLCFVSYHVSSIFLYITPIFTKKHVRWDHTWNIPM